MYVYTYKNKMKAWFDECKLMRGKTMHDIKVEIILFKGKQNISWKDVELYIKRYQGKSFIIEKYNDQIILNYEFIREFAGSRYTRNLRGALAKVKANISQIIPDLICKADNRRWIENKAEKHVNQADGGWYRYDVHFSFPVQIENNPIKRWNDYCATLVVKINRRGLYLYDIINIKKEARNPGGSKN